MPPIMVLNSNVGMKMLGGGLVPGMIEQNAIQTKSETYLAALKQRNLTFGPELAAALKASLNKGGYEVEYLESQAPVWRAGEPDITSVKTNADTVLQVLWGRGGYLSPDFDDHYTPLVNFAVSAEGVQATQRLVADQVAVQLAK